MLQMSYKMATIYVGHGIGHGYLAPGSAKGLNLL